ncbi:hypothetical protein Dsin_003433 [Dipteronia sinensis]|uniref:RNase H type-1 domain-containing protein n=1 Tax=Dipteronia sinensis TaxID=43782 RepID=A0AAE0B940_9ROSI|nr:hypothetical protein Dsin_003433 [Dipteronia sinensis]
MEVFLNFLECIRIRSHIPDGIAWTCSSNGMFSMRAFCEALEESLNVNIAVPDFIWQGHCPPKIEVFVWQLWRGRVFVKEVLHKHGMDQMMDLECPFCQDDNESIDHIFLHCPWSRSLLLNGMSWWGVKGCVNNTVNKWLEGWIGLCPEFKHERAWCSLFFTIVWTIWEYRNQLVFEGKEPIFQQATDLVKFRVVWWFKYLGRGSNDPVDTFLRNLPDLCVEHKKVKVNKIVDWIPPLPDNLKFNVDGSSRGKPGPSGIGGVMRDSNEKVLCLFSFYVGIFDSNVAEIWAIKKAVDLYLSNPNLHSRDITVVSDSKVAVSWVHQSDFGNIQHVSTIYDTRNSMKSFGSLKVVFDSRIF